MKETKEALIATVTLGKLVYNHVKDGVQMNDAVAIGTALLSDEKLKALLADGFKGMDKIDDEFKDFGIAKAFELAQVLPHLVKILRS